jgi:protein involved in polysaccharide export with SLBB domain
VVPQRVVETTPDVPLQIQLPSPYADLISLHDLYTQIPSAGPKLRRFGSDVFVIGPGNVNELPADLPVGPDYVLGAGDGLVVNMWGGHSERLIVVIDRQGQIALPEAGTITIDGLTIAQAQNAIQKALSTQFEGEHVEISLGRLRTVRVYVVGEVQRPGAYDVSSLSTPLSALYAAGGPTSRGSLRILRQYRGKQLVREIDLYDFLLHGVRSNSDRLMPGDTIMVPPVGAQVTVEGMVHHPAVYELNGEHGLNEVLDLAGGVLVSASLKQINVERLEAHQHRTMLTLDLPDNAEEVKQKLAGFRVQSGDDVVIAQILPYNEQAVYLEGHVYRPGKYPYRDGMTISDLVHSYQDVLPEPSDHAELVRLLPPDFRPEIIPFNLRDVLIGNDSLKLQPFDTIRVFGRYEIDSASVTIQGNVLRPGSFPLSEGMKVTDLMHMAGDFTRNAYRAEADLTSYVIQNGQRVLANHSVVQLQNALDGDKSADVLLKPGDVLSIRTLSGWQDIGATVSINGEVDHPGAYGIVPGERLSAVLKRAGGFRDAAYPTAAVLERVQVRELAEQARQQMILRIENTPIDYRPGTMSEQAAGAMQMALQQERNQALAALRSHPVSGRLVINISTDIAKWENTPADIQLRAGDTLNIPKRPDFVTITGQVYNSIAINYVPGKELDWYLRKSGGPTPSGDKKHIYVLRADGSVVPRVSARGTIWLGDNFTNLHMSPGDTIFIPEKILGGSPVWQNIIGIAQVMSAAALPIAMSGTL